MPMSRRAVGTFLRRPALNTVSPPSTIVPAVGCSRPATQRNVVVLPHPELPSSVKNAPVGTSKLTPSTAATDSPLLRKTFCRSSTTSARSFTFAAITSLRSHLLDAHAAGELVEQADHHDQHADHEDAHRRHLRDVATLPEVEQLHRQHVGAGADEQHRRRELAERDD